MRLRKRFEGARRARELFGSAQRAVVLRSCHARESVGAVVLGGEPSCSGAAGGRSLPGIEPAG